MSELPHIIVSSADFRALTHLLPVLEPHMTESLELLWRELERAEIVDPHDVPGDVVTMNSRVRFSIEGAARTLEMTLCYPKDVDGNVQNVSILAPIGSALLGLRIGQEIDWALPDGRTKRIRILDILYQPERSGNFAV